MPNPFKPTFGTNPYVLVGRDDIVEDFKEAFSEGPGNPKLSVLLSGQRGVGKTVMLNEYQDAAAQAGWLAISESASGGLLERMARDHLPRLLATYSPTGDSKLSGAGVTAGAIGVDANWESRYPAEATVRSQIQELGGYLAERDTGLVITVDEIQSADIEEMRKLGEIVQYAHREDRALGFAAAGLTGFVDDLLSHAGTTFLRRAEHYTLGSIPLDDVKQALATTIADNDREIEPAALDAATAATRGYPYLIQLVGYEVWRVNPKQKLITAADAEVGVQAAKAGLGTRVHEPAMRELSDVDRRYLHAMAIDSGASRTGDVADRLGVSPQYASSYRARLINSGLIEPAGYGLVRYAIPYLGEYLNGRTG